MRAGLAPAAAVLVLLATSRGDGRWLMGWWAGGPRRPSHTDGRRGTLTKPLVARRPKQGVWSKAKKEGTRVKKSKALVGAEASPAVILYSHEWTKTRIFHARAAEQATPLHRLRRRRLTLGTQP